MQIITPGTDRNPLIPACLSFAAGALAAKTTWLPALANTLWPVIVLLAVCLVLLSFKKPLSRNSTLAIILGAFFLCGLIYADSFINPIFPPHHLTQVIDKNAEGIISGTLCNKPVFKGDKTRFIIETESIILPPSKLPVHATGRVMLTVKASRLSWLEPGHKYAVRAKLSLPSPPSTPGVFDYSAHLASEGIYVKGWVESPLFIAKVIPAPEEATALSPIYQLEKFRMRFADFLQVRLAPEHAGLYQALLIGDSNNLSPEILAIYRATGIMHILAISGSHFVILVFLLVSFFRFLICLSTRLLLAVPANKIAITLSLPLILLYSGLAGFQPPVVRAMIMTGILMSAILIDRQWSSLNNLAIAAFCILITNPASIFSASFQLSFAAAAAIIIVMPDLYVRSQKIASASRLQSARQWLLSALAISFAAFLATTPLALLHFNYISLLGPLTTLLVTPFLCFWSLPLGLFAIGAYTFSPEFSALLLTIGIPGIEISNSITASLMNLPFTTFWLPTPDPLRLGFAFMLILAILHYPRRLFINIFLLAVLSFTLSGYNPMPTSHANLATVSFLSVGNGSATVIQSPDDRVIVIDGGGFQNDNFNPGERIIAPFLWHKNIRRIEQIIVTHPHADHFNGLAFIIKRFKPKVLWISESEYPEPGFTELLNEATRTGCSIRIAGTGEVLLINESGDFAINCLINLALTDERLNQSPEVNNANNPNNRGLILRLDHGQKAFIFPGDIEKNQESSVVAYGKTLRADVLLMPHHGLNSSGSVKFMEVIKPSYYVVSTGEKTPFPPAQYQDLRAEIYSTARHGSIFFTSDGKSLKTSHHLQMQ